MLIWAQVLGMSTSANEWTQNLIHSQKAHMNWKTGTAATSFIDTLSEDAERRAKRRELSGMAMASHGASIDEMADDC